MVSTLLLLNLLRYLSVHKLKARCLWQSRQWVNGSWVNGSNFSMGHMIIWSYLITHIGIAVIIHIYHKVYWLFLHFWQNMNDILVLLMSDSYDSVFV